MHFGRILLLIIEIVNLSIRIKIYSITLNDTGNFNLGRNIR